MRIKIPKLSEHQDQSLFFESILYSYRLDQTFSRSLFFSVPNGAFLGGNRFAYMDKLKREGFLPGVSDILYLQPRGGFCYLAIELKTEEKRGRKGGGLSEEQDEFLRAAREAGAQAFVCYGHEEAIKAFNLYMALEYVRMSPQNKKDRRP